MRCSGLLILLFLALAGLTGRAGAQQQEPNVTIAVDVTEDTGGLFASDFSTALRALPNVAVVSQAESPRYSLHVVVLCNPEHDCPHAASYTLAIAFSAPLSRFAVAFAAISADTALTRAATDNIFAQLPPAETLYQLTVVRWGREKYERAIREYVAQLDQQCFERSRMFDRESVAIRAQDRTTVKGIEQEIDRRHWIC